MRDSNIPVYDITPLMVMNSKDVLVFGGFVLVLCIVMVLVGLWAVRKIQSRPMSFAQIRMQQWDNISMDDSKKAAYKMSEIGRFFATENDEVKLLFDRLERELVQYKYAKNVKPLGEEVLQLYMDFSTLIK